MADPGPEPDPSWPKLCARAAAQLARHGHLRRAGEQTRRWADQQIRGLRTGTLPDNLRRELHSIGITPDFLTTTETTLLAELDWWIARHGDATVPQMAHSRTISGTSYWLGKRVSETRIAYARGTLPPALAAQLEQRTGWSWRVKESRWEQMWETKLIDLTQHVAAHGSLEGLTRATYAWLLRQRADLDQLPPERQQRLANIPGALISRDTRVPDFVAAARTWLHQAPPHATGRPRTMSDLKYSDTIDAGGTSIPLGKRASYYRRRHAGLEGTHPLSTDEVAQIEALPGWAWQIQDQRRTRADTKQTAAAGAKETTHKPKAGRTGMNSGS